MWCSFISSLVRSFVRSLVIYLLRACVRGFFRLVVIDGAVLPFGLYLCMAVFLSLGITAFM